MAMAAPSQREKTPMHKLFSILVCAAALETAAQALVQIHADLSKSQGAYKPIYSWFGYDEANYTDMKYGKQLLRELHDLAPVPVYIRAHHLLTSGNGVPELKWSSTNVYTIDASGKPVYDFAILDRIFDTYREAGVRPLVELGFMPKDLSTMADPYQVHYPGNTTSGGSNYPPKDYEMWGQLVRKVTEHLVQRYGRQEVATWYWEVWNEPDISYWHGTAEEYYKLYDYAVDGVRAALPGARVGGPASTGPGASKAAEFLNGFLGHCAHDKSAANAQRIPLDFISFHVKGRPTLVGSHVRMGLDKEMLDAKEGFRIVSSYPMFIKLPILLSEADPEGCAACSSKVNPSNAYRNGPLYPTYTAAAIKGLFELQDRYKVNLIAMLSWSFEFEGQQYFEGFRSLATNGVHKPVLNVFRMAGLMSGERVPTSSTAAVPLDSILKAGVTGSPDIDAIGTREDHQAALMIWNYHDDDVPAEATPVRITVVAIPQGVHRVLLQHYRIDETHSNAYTTWKGMGSPQSPTPAQLEQLRRAGQLQQMNSPEWISVHGGEAVLTTTLPRQAVSLLLLKWKE